MKYLIFSELNRNHFLFLSYFIISIIIEIDNKYIKSTDDIVDTFHKCYIHTLSDFLSIIPFIIIKLRSKGISKREKLEKIKANLSEKNSNENLVERTSTESSIDIAYKYLNATFKEKKEKAKKRKIKLSLLVSVFEFLAIYLDITFSIIAKTNNYAIKFSEMDSQILFKVMSKYILSIIILHSPVYKHHYLCLAVNIIFLIILVILDVMDIVKTKDNLYFLYAVLKIIIAILFSFEDVYAKVLFSLGSFSTYIYLLYRGIFVNSFALLFSIIFIFVKLPDEKGQKSIVFTRIWKVYENKLNILLYIIFFIFMYLLNLNIFLIIDKFSPIHFAVASTIYNSISLIISCIYGQQELKEFFIKIAVYFILIISALVYNEIIILNFCGLQKYTSFYLHKQASEDIRQTIITKNIIDNDFINEGEENKSLEMINIGVGNSNYDINESDLYENDDMDNDE